MNFSPYLKIIAACVLTCQGLRPPLARGAEVVVLEQPQPFARSYFGVEQQKSFPTFMATDYWAPDRATLHFTYHFVLDNNWAMGLGAGAKQLRDTAGAPFPIMELSHETDYIFRITHPIYLLTGVKFFYLVPAKQISFPIDRNPEYEVEIGAGLTATAFYLIDKSWALSLRGDRWRGTASNVFHAFEFAAGVHYAFESSVP